MEGKGGSGGCSRVLSKGHMIKYWYKEGLRGGTRMAATSWDAPRGSKKEMLLLPYVCVGPHRYLLLIKPTRKPAGKTDSLGLAFLNRAERAGMRSRGRLTTGSVHLSGYSPPTHTLLLVFDFCTTAMTMSCFCLIKSNPPRYAGRPTQSLPKGWRQNSLIIPCLCPWVILVPIRFKCKAHLDIM